jgi:broad specificity phosphatase PhoE
VCRHRLVGRPGLPSRAGGDYEGRLQQDFFALSEEEQIKAGAESFASLAGRARAMIEFAQKQYTDQVVLFVGSAAIGEMMRAIIKYNDPARMFDDGPLPNAELVQFL